MAENPRFLFPVGDIGSSRGFIPGKHAGIDFLSPVGTPVHAAADGVVIYEANEPGGYGNIITIEHVPGGWQTRYAHLSVFRVSNGMVVKSGDVIALSGGAQGAAGSGNSDGPHLHFEVRKDPNTPVDPRPLLAGTSNVPDQGSGKANSGGSNPISAIGDFFDTLTDGQTWVRVGEVIGGIALLWIAYTILTKDMSSLSQLRSAING